MSERRRWCTGESSCCCFGTRARNRSLGGEVSPRSAALGGASSALRAAQEQNHGFLTADLMDAVADYLQLPPIPV